MTSAMQKLDDGTIQLTIPIPWSEVQKTRETVISEAISTAEMPGFRKGKAPREVVEKSLDETRLRDEVLKKLLPQSYITAVQDHKLQPIMNPKISVQKIEDGKDWEFLAQTVELPEIILGKYKQEVKKITAKSKIAIPGKEKTEVNFDEVMKAVLDSAQLTIPALLIEGEVDRQLSNTLDEIKKLGLSLDQYLSSTGKTAEALREDYRKKAENDIKIEFILQKIAEEEKISVEEKEIEEAVQKAKDEDERQHLEANKYLLANIIRQQKTLDFLRNL